MTRTLRLALVVPALAASVAGCTIQMDAQAFIEREEKRFPAGATPEVHLTTFDGSIQVRPWDRPEVLVEIEKRGSDKEAVSSIQIVADAKDNTVSVDVRKPSGEKEFIGIGIHHSTSARLIASVPRGAKLVVSTRDGSITVERVDGQLELRTDDGSVRVSEAPGDVLIVTRDGSITLDRVAGRVDARSGDGSIRVTGTPTALTLETRDGSVAVRAERGTEMADDWSVRTGDGTVVVELPDGFGAELDAETQDGSVRNSLDMPNASTEDESRRNDRRSLRGRIGAGGKTLRLRTSDGSIRLRAS
ncbi:MAG: DUF4097 domain-containing protein [Acidobacteriota bacterium]|nr:DUF4097 domain-containing protein [Acidobacteriota bacterium]